MKKREDRLGFCAPMEINKDGEVVFVEPKERPDHLFRPRMERRHKKPTPLMLCNEISKMFRNIMRDRTDDPEIQGSYRDILYHLAHEDGRTQLELARLTHLTPPTISVTLQKLEDQGYVERKTDPIDQRKIRVYLTEKGKQIDERAHGVIAELEALASKNFSEDEQKTLMVLLFRLRENITDEKLEK